MQIASSTTLPRTARAPDDPSAPRADELAASPIFGDFLTATQSLLTASTDRQLSPSLMFEPGARDAHAQRQDAMRQTGDEAAGSSKVSRMDTTSVQARLAAGGDLEKSASVEPTKADGRAMGSTAHREMAGQQAPADLGIRSVEPGVRDAMSVRQGITRQGVAGDAARKVGSSDSTPVMSTQTVASGAVDATGNSSTSIRGDVVAQQVGQLLAAARGGEGESGRSVSPTQSVDQVPGTRAGSERDARATSDAQAARPRSAREPAMTRSRSADFDQLVRSIRMKAGLNRSSARIRIDPPELGRMLVDVDLSRDVLRIHVRTESAEARDSLHDRLMQLRAALQQQGIHVDRFEVTVGLDDDTSPEAPADHSSERESGETGVDQRQRGAGQSFLPAHHGGVADHSDWGEGELRVAPGGELGVANRGEQVRAATVRLDIRV